jgi:SAM-dependent methyltransferase
MARLLPGSNDDAFGEELWAQFKTGQSYELVERDDGLVGIAPPARYFNDYDLWSENEKEAIKFVKGRTLDIGCGAGRVALYLQKQGLPATGVDISPLAVKICRLRGLKDARQLSIDSIGKLDRNSFDTVVMFGNNFGLLGSPLRAKQFLKQLYKITTPVGQIVAEAADPYRTKEPVHKAYHQLNKRRGRLPGQLRIRIRFADKIGPWMDYLFVSRAEMKRILKGTGWRMARVIDSNRPAYIVILRKIE